jgi:hypothetical protein
MIMKYEEIFLSLIQKNIEEFLIHIEKLVFIH